MWLKLPADYIHPKTRMPLPDAVLVVADVEFRMRAGDTRVIAAIFTSPEAIQLAEPVQEFPMPLSMSERNSQLPFLLQALYTIIAARPEYSGSTLVP